jgi:hypothetical protein
MQQAQEVSGRLSRVVADEWATIAGAAAAAPKPHGGDQSPERHVL